VSLGRSLTLRHWCAISILWSERVILRCLETDPEKRPATTLQVAAALPGGDPLAAALAAGETPSPQMVAAAGGYRRDQALVRSDGLVVTALLGLVALMMLADIYRVQNLTAARKAIRRASRRVRRKLFNNLDSRKRRRTPLMGLSRIMTISTTFRNATNRKTRWQRLGSDRPATILFWYRQSPREMQSDNFFNSIGSGVITPWDPPSDVTGMISVFLDTQGRLLLFKRIPPERDPPSGPSHSARLVFAVLCCGSRSVQVHLCYARVVGISYIPTRERHGLVKFPTTPIQATERLEAARLSRETGLFPGFVSLGRPLP